MKLTKYVHACVVLEKEGKRLVIDPGSFTDDFGGTDNVAAVIVTHVHGDHFNPEHVHAILAANPDVQIFSTAEATEQASELPITVPKLGQTYTAGPYQLQFLGELHAEIHRSAKRNLNIGVLVDGGAVYFPGDAFTEPGVPVNVLLTPASGPWLKMGEAMDLVLAVKPKVCVPTHDALLSERGYAINENWLSGACQQAGAKLARLNTGQSIEV